LIAVAIALPVPCLQRLLFDVEVDLVHQPLDTNLLRLDGDRVLKHSVEGLSGRKRFRSTGWRYGLRIADGRSDVAVRWRDTWPSQVVDSTLEIAFREEHVPLLAHRSQEGRERCRPARIVANWSEREVAR
jgi:hypothetical protein